jgi:uncharacterized protein
LIVAGLRLSMILKETLRAIVLSQRDVITMAEKGIAREKAGEITIDAPFAIVLSGIRRCGKSTLLRQLIKAKRNFYYFNFEDPRATDFEASDFQKLNEVFWDECGKSKFYFFDEIQNVKNWELFVRQILDRQGHVIITGSNASLLSKELGTRLTGRHLRYELFPFSYGEFLRLKKIKAGIASFEKYFQHGGFPEYLKLDNNQILQELFNDIVMRDVVVRHHIRSAATAKSMALYLLTNVGTAFSYHKLKKLFNISSVNTAISFVSCFEDAYLLFTVPKFDYSLKRQIVNPKKVYSIDNGLSNVNSASFSADKGKMLENMVYMSLRADGKKIFYLQEKGECDFVIKERNKIVEAIQVCFEVTEDNKKREISGLMEALTKFNLGEGVILTYNQDDEFLVENKKVRVMSVWKWLLR